jgi:pyruvate kinase
MKNFTELIQPKICVTLGLSFASGKLRVQDLASVDIARLSTAHMDNGTIGKIIKARGDINKRMLIWYDLQGPKIRIDDSYPCGQQSVKASDKLCFCVPGDLPYFSRIYGEMAVPLRLDIPFAGLEHADQVLIKDGSTRLEILRNFCKEPRPGLEVRACSSFVIRRGKSVNITGIDSSQVPSLTNQDAENLAWAVGQGVDIVCLSFVNSAESVRLARKIIASNIGKKKAGPRLWAKIETQAGCEHFDEIARAADGIVLGRGDLIPEVGLFDAVRWQWDLLGRHAAMFPSGEKDFIVATHILASMRMGSSPSISELNDIYQCLRAKATGFLLATEVSAGDAPGEPISALRSFLGYLSDKAPPPGENVVKRKGSRGVPSGS